MTSIIVRINIRVGVGKGVLSKREPLLCFLFKKYFLEVVEGNNWVFNYSWDKINEHHLNL